MKRLLLSMLVALALTAVSRADPRLDFGIVAPTLTGSISYAGGASPLVGLNIEVDNVVGLGGTPANNNVVLDCVGCVLNFTTGASNGAWTWGGGGGTLIEIVGSIPDLSLGAGTILMSGIFGNAFVIDQGNNSKLSGSGFFDRKNERLATYYGLGDVPAWSGNWNISFAATGVSPDAFKSSEIFSGDVVNTPVPEPASMLLLGSGLLGFASFARKKIFKS